MTVLARQLRLIVPAVLTASAAQAIAAVPVPVRVDPAATYFNASQPTAVGDQLYFTAYSFSSGIELYRTGGTPATTLRVADIRPGSQDSAPMNLTPFGDTLLFSAQAQAGNRELWRADVANGAALVSEIFPGTSPGLGSDPGGFVVTGGWAYFAATGPNGRQLYKTQGTAATTSLVKAIGSFSGGNPQFLTAAGTTLYFWATDTGTGTELWSSNGTTAGTQLAKDLTPGSGGSAPMALAAVGANVYFNATGSITGTLHKSDGTPGGTHEVANMTPGQQTFFPLGMTPLGPRIIYAGGTPGGERTVYATTIADDSTVAIVDPLDPNRPRNPNEFTLVGDHVYFTALDGAGRRGLWVTDGTTGGTQEVPTGAGEVGQLHAVNGYLFYELRTLIDPAFSQYNADLWYTDGTPGGGGRLYDNPFASGQWGLYGIAAIGDTVYFTAPTFAGTQNYGDQYQLFAVSLPALPEPGSLGLLGAGALALARGRRAPARR